MTTARNKSVLVLGNFLSASLGLRGVCEDFAEKLGEAGWHVHTASNKPGRILRMMDILGAVWLKRKEYDFATLDLFSGMAFVWAELAAFLLARLGKPYILILHGGSLPEFARRWPDRVTRLLGSAACVTAPSAFLLERMRPYRRDIRFLPNPIDLTRYGYRARSAISPNFVWLRAFHEIYNPSLCVKVFDDVRCQHPSAQLTMLGPDKADGSFEKARDLAKSLGADANILWPGKIPNKDVPAWLEKSDIFLNTTNVDNTPISVIEALACGLCVVSTNVGGIPYLLTHNENALLVPPDSPAEMGNAINRLLLEPGLSERLSVNARRKAEQFDWKVILPQWERLFEETIYG